VNGGSFRLLLPQIEESLFEHALWKSKENQNKASQMLGLHRNTLNKKLQRLAR
jgi:DNA-binding protein Fis